MIFLAEWDHTKEMKRKALLMSCEIRSAMVAHAQAELPNEACGLLCGEGNLVQRLILMRNADESPLSFRLDAREQLLILRDIEAQNLELLAIFHSHVKSEAYPSQVDVDHAYSSDVLYVVVSLAKRFVPSVRAFSIVGGVIREWKIQLTSARQR